MIETEKQADALGVLADALVSTFATRMLLGDSLVNGLLPSFISIGGMAALAEPISDLIAPRIEMLLGTKTKGECYAVRAAVAAAYTIGVQMMFAPMPMDLALRVAAGAALGSVAGTYVFDMYTSSAAPRSSKFSA